MSVDVARFRAQSAIVTPFFGSAPPGNLLVYDVLGEVGAAGMRERLLVLRLDRTPDVVILRGLSDALMSEIGAGGGIADITDAFPTASVYLLRFSPAPELVHLCGAEITPDTVAELIISTREAELTAALVRSEAVWSASNYHFITPSDIHSDKFIRLGDMFDDRFTVSRVADWCWHLIEFPSVLCADTILLLPLLQELELRYFKQHGAALRMQVLPGYGSQASEFTNRLSEIVPDARAIHARVVCLVSVSASGGYIAKFEQELARFQDPPACTVQIICQASPQRNGSALVNIESQHFRSKTECRLCERGSTPLEIDQRRFTTTLGTTILKLPDANQMQVHTVLLAEAVAVEALRVHVDRHGQHDHLGIYIDIESLLRSKVFRATATLGIAQTLHGFSPELTLIPAHSGSPHIQRWWHEETGQSSALLPLGEPLSDELLLRIQAANSILVLDDSVISARTMRAALDVVQGIKEGVNDQDYLIRAFVLVARPASYDTWRGLRERFYIGKAHRLSAAWELNLPDTGYDDSRHRCPWCNEAQVLEATIHRAPKMIRGYLETRLARLRSGTGLANHLFLASELITDEGPSSEWYHTAIHTSPGSYLGSISDVGAYVGCAAMLQKMRNDWAANAKRFSTAYSVPLDVALRRFTDPVIAAALVRGTAAHELQSVSLVEPLNQTFMELHHLGQHPVFAAEILLADHAGKFPRRVNVEHLQTTGKRCSEVVAALLEFLGS